MGGHYHDSTASSQNCGNHIGDRSSVRQSKLYRRYESGNQVKDLLGQGSLKWDENRKQGAYSGPVFDHNKKQHNSMRSLGKPSAVGQEYVQQQRRRAGQDQEYIARLEYEARACQLEDSIQRGDYDQGITGVQNGYTASQGGNADHQGMYAAPPQGWDGGYAAAQRGYAAAQGGYADPREGYAIPQGMGHGISASRGVGDQLGGNIEALVRDSDSHEFGRTTAPSVLKTRPW